MFEYNRDCWLSQTHSGIDRAVPVALDLTHDMAAPRREGVTAARTTAQKAWCCWPSAQLRQATVALGRA
jgi:hypothetical protein